LTRELEARRWFEKSPAESPAERAAMHCLAKLPMEQREVIVLKIWHRCTFDELAGAGHFAQHRRGPIPLRFAKDQTLFGKDNV